MPFWGELPHFFGDTSSDWDVFSERLEQFIELNDVPEDKKKALLITCIADDAYSRLREICHPTLPKEKTFKELSDMLQAEFYHVKDALVVRKRHAFDTAKQYDYEETIDWLERLRRESVGCKLGANNQSIIVERFIDGMLASPVRDRLLEQKGELTIQRAYEAAVAIDIENAGKKKDGEEFIDRDQENRGRGPQICGFFDES